MNQIFYFNCLITSILSLAFAFFIILNRQKAQVLGPVWLWGIFCFIVAVWSFGLGMMTSANTFQDAWLWLRVHQFAAVVIPTLFVHFIFSLLNKLPQQKGLLVGGYGITLLLIILMLTGKLVKPVPIHPFTYYTAAADFYHYYTLYFFLCILYGHTLLIQKLRSSQGFEKKQIQYFLLGSVIGFIGGSSSFLPIYGVNVFPYGLFFVFLYVFIVGYAILKYQLLSIQVVIRRAVLLVGVYLLLLFGAGPILYTLHKSLLGPSSIPVTLWILDIGIMSFFLSLGPFLYAFFVRRSRFFQENTMAGLTHELKSPLASIESAIEILNDSSKSGHLHKNALKEYLEMIKQNTTRLSTFVNDLLSVYREREGKTKLELETLSIGELCAKVVKSLQNNGLPNNNKIRFENAAPDLHLALDETKIGQVLSNLISNAVKFTENDIIMVKTERKNGLAYVSVEDHGRGIPPYDINKVFDRFFQGKNATAAKGTGIGLTISKFWIKAHGGRIWAHSDGEGKGTVVTFALPVKK